MKKEYLAGAIVFGVVLLTIFGLTVFSKTDSSLSTPEPTQVLQSATSQPSFEEEENMATPPSMQIDKNKSYSAILTTDLGKITIELDVIHTPITANNFVSLSREGFYNNVIFHRVIDGFMIQGGDPTGTGSGGPGYQFADEYLEGNYTRGTVAMANAGPDTNGSQFFIMHADYALPNNYVIFGKVSEGMEVVDKIATAETKTIGEGSSPVNPVKITSVEIVEK